MTRILSIRRSHQKLPSSSAIQTIGSCRRRRACFSYRYTDCLYWCSTTRIVDRHNTGCTIYLDAVRPFDFIAHVQFQPSIGFKVEFQTVDGFPFVFHKFSVGRVDIAQAIAFFFSQMGLYPSSLPYTGTICITPFSFQLRFPACILPAFISHHNTFFRIEIIILSVDGMPSSVELAGGIRIVFPFSTLNPAAFDHLSIAFCLGRRFKIV